MALVDAHTHFFARPFFQALAELSPRPGGSAALLEDLVHSTGVELPPADVGRHLARWTAELDRHGVDHAVAFASAPPEIPAVAEAARLAGGRLSTMAIVDPTAPGAAERVAGLLDQQGFSGVLTFPAMHGFHPCDEAVRPVLAVLEDRRAVCYVHCGLLVVKLRDALGLPRRYDLRYADPLGLVPAALAFPNVRFVIPHFGAGFLRETLLAGAQCPNVHVDTSSSHAWIATQPAHLCLYDVFERALGVFGPRRILFGTDSGTFPAGWRHDRYAEQQAVLERLGAPAEDVERIFAGNALELLGRVPLAAPQLGTASSTRGA